MTVHIIHAQHIDAAGTFYQHLHRTIGQLEHLQNIRHAADGK